MSQLPPKTVSELLANWHAGDDDALRATIPLVYDELRLVAHRYLQKERPGHTLQSTGSVLLSDVGRNLLREFGPDLKAKFFSTRLGARFERIAHRVRTLGVQQEQLQ